MERAAGADQRRGDPGDRRIERGPGRSDHQAEDRLAGSTTSQVALKRRNGKAERNTPSSSDPGIALPVIEAAASGDNRGSAGAEPPRRRGRQKENGAGVSTGPVSGSAGVFRPGRFQIGFLKASFECPRSGPGEASFDKTFRSSPAPRRRFRRDFRRKWVRRRVSPRPRASSPAALPELPRSQSRRTSITSALARSEAFARFQAATPDREARPWQPLAIRGKRISACG